MSINCRHIAVSMMCMLSVTVNAQQAMDVHCHNVPSWFSEAVEAHGAGMAEGFPLPEWEIGKQLTFMNENGIGKSLLSMPAPQPFFGSKEESCRLVRRYNDECAKLKSEYSNRFLFCASLPLPDVEDAIREAIYALDTLKADGIKMATNVYGQYLGDSALDTLMSVLNERHAVIVIHPHRPTPINEKIIAATPLAAYEYPAETTRAVINMLVRNVPARYPNLRFIIPHCGSFLPLALPRLKAIHPAMHAKGLMQSIDWEKNIENLYFDLSGNPTKEVIDALLSITTPSHLLYGSDYPYQPSAVLQSGKKRMIEWMEKDPRLSSQIKDILSGNAERLFIRQ